METAEASQQAASADAGAGGPVVLYDGACGLCARTVQVVLDRDRAGRFRFAALQSGYGREALRRHGLDPDRLDTFGLLLDPGGAGERLLVRGEAAVALGRALGGAYRAAAALARLLPRRLLDWGYDRVARNRHRLGAPRACRVPTPDERRRFIEAAPGAERA